MNVARLRTAAAEATYPEVAKYSAELLSRAVDMAISAGVRPEQIPALRQAAKEAAQAALNPQVYTREGVAGFVNTPEHYKEYPTYEEKVALIRASAAEAAAFALSAIRYGAFRTAYDEAKSNGVSAEKMAEFKKSYGEAAQQFFQSFIVPASVFFKNFPAVMAAVRTVANIYGAPSEVDAVFANMREMFY